MEISIDLSKEVIVDSIVNLGDSTVVEIVKYIDKQTQSWEVTRELSEYFILEMRRYFDNDKQFLNFIAEFMED